MSYNAFLSALLEHFGIKPTQHLPAEGMAPRRVDTWIRKAPRNGGGQPLPVRGLEIWINPIGSAAGLFRRSTHRVMCKCPRCGSTLAAGRLHQHIETAACNAQLQRLMARASRVGA